MKKKLNHDLTQKRETFERLHNKKLTSRREFLGAGLIPFSAYMVLPTWVEMFARSGEARAQELICKAAGTADMAAFIGIKLSGGAGLSANFVPFRKDLQPLSSYSKMGLGLSSRFAISREFSNGAPFYDQSSLLTGVKQNATLTTLLNSSFVGVCVRSQDDSSNNRFDVTGLVTKSGLNGKILPNLGRSNTDTGANQVFAYLRPPAPLVVGRFEDVTGSLGVAGSLASLSASQKAKLFQTVQGLTADQSRKLASQTGGEALAKLIQCANIDNTNLVANASALNISPLANAAFATLWGINAQTNTSSQAFVFATMVYNAINGNAGTVNLDMGGYDYHNGTRATGDQRDLEAGVVIGRVLQSLAVMGKKGFVVVTSDGSVSSAESNDPGSPWMSDRGSAGCAYMIAYDPAKPPVVTSFQLGQFTDPGQAADDNFIVGGSPEIAAGAIFANYLAFNGKSHLIENYLPRVFTSAELDMILKFTGA